MQLKWESEFVARGLAFGREGAWSKDGKPAQTGPVTQHADMFLRTPNISSYHFVNLSLSDFEPDPAERMEYLAEYPRPGLEIAKANRRFASAHLSPHISPYPTFMGFDSSLLEYYLSRLCPLTVPSAGVTSPFASLVIPLFASGGRDYILMSVMALAARHRSLTDPKWTRVAMSLKGRVLTAVRQLLESSEMATDVVSDSQIPVAMMFLCLDEILDNCDHRWVIHLRAGQDFIRHRRRLLPSSSDDDENGQLVRFSERFFAYQDVISRTACGNAPIFGLEYWQSADRRGYDIWTGCSSTLTSIIFRITELARARDRENVSVDVLARDAEVLGQESSSFDIRSAVIGLDDTLIRSEYLKKASVELYYYCLVDDDTPASPRASNLVKQILQETMDLVVLGCVSGLMFPLFTAAVELDPLDDEESYENLMTGEFVSGRRLVLEILDAMSGVALANVERTAAVIRKVWRMRDLDLHDDHESRLVDVKQNDWSRYVNPYSLNISLA